MSGKLELHLDVDSAVEGPLVACDIIDARTGQTKQASVGVGGPSLVEVPEGTYLVRASLPSGRVVAQTAQIADDETTSVALSFQTQVPAGPQAIASGDVGSAIVAEPTATKPGAGQSAAEAMMRRALWARTWEGGEPAPWEREDQATRTHYRVQIPEAGAQSFQVGGEDAAWRIVCLPPIRWLTVSVSLERSGATAALEEAGHSFDDGVAVEIASSDPVIDALLDFLTSGQVDQARAIAPSAVSEARALFERKAGSPEGAAVAGYYLLRVGEQDVLGEWTDNFANWFGWLPDALVIHAWQLLRRRGVPDRTKARERLLDAVVPGVPPRYSEGVRLLYEGLTLFAASDPGDKAAAEKLLEFQRYAAACDYSAPLTSYWARRPDEPTLERIVGEPQDAPDLVRFELESP